MNSCDAFLLGVLIALTGARGVSAPDPTLQAALGAAVKASYRKADVGASNPLALLNFNELRVDSTLEPSGCVLYSLPSILRTERLAGLDPNITIFPFAFRAAALWSSRLAWCCTKPFEDAAAVLLEQTERFIGSEWFDPFTLFEKLQSLRAWEDGVEGSGETKEDLSARIARLEEELRILELSGLVRHEALLSSAARRRQSGQ